MPNDRAEHDHPNGVVPQSFVARCVTACSIAITFLALALLVWYSVRVLLLIFGGILIAVLFRGLSDGLSQWTRLPQRVSLIIIVTLFAGLLIGGWWLAAPRLMNESLQMVERLPEAVAGLRQKLETTRWGRLFLREAPTTQPMLGSTTDALWRLGGAVSSVLTVTVGLLVVLFTGLFLAFSPQLYMRGLLHLLPPSRRARSAEVLGSIGYTLKWWLIGQAIDMLVIGLATGIGLGLLGVPLAALLGFIAALFNFIPNFGPLFSLVPAVLLTLPTDPTKAMYVVILFLILQNLEGYLLMPLIQRRAVDLPGALTIVAQVLMGMLAGGLGLALAAPLAAAGVVAVKMLYVDDFLGDRVKTPADGDARAEVKEVKKAAADVARSRKSP